MGRNGFCFYPRQQMSPSGVCDMTITRILRAVLFPLLAVTGLWAAPSAQAIPMDYTVNYSGSTAGPAFTGSFTWDADTSIFTDFIWNLSATPDTLGANSWATSFFGGTLGQFLFETLTSEDVHPTACTLSSRCTFTSNRVTSSLVSSVEFRSLALGIAEYSFTKAGVVLYSGTLSVARVVLQVSEPLAWLLMGAGLLIMALARRTARPT
jgi:hypothetical protein